MHHLHDEKHADGLHGNIVHLSKERTMPKNLEPSLSQTSHQFKIISKLASSFTNAQKICTF